jgi:hypothetical protein
MSDDTAVEGLREIVKDEDIMYVTVYVSRVQWQYARGREALMREKVENAVESLQRFAQERWPDV